MEAPMTRYAWLAVAMAFVLTSGGAIAQSPYAGMQARTVKALSDQQIADLKAGRGMGLALAAELNGYPGPAHLLELADQLSLTESQRAEVARLFDAMKSEAVPLGERLIHQETDLDRMFATRTITPENLRAATQAIGETEGALRDTHLKYHLSTLALLTPAQVERYAQLRGYGEAHAVGHHHMDTH
jgi:Spy/CpxP family protein refolding chaperone